MTLDDAASQRQHASDIADSDVVKSERPDRTPTVSAILVEQMIDLAIKREREACAKLAEDRLWRSTAAECSGECPDDIAAAIRART